MTHAVHFEFDPVQHIIISTIRGRISPSDVMSTLRQSIAMVRQHRAIGLIGDCVDGQTCFEYADLDRMIALADAVFAGLIIPVAWIEPNNYPMVKMYAIKARQRGRPTIACLTYAEAYAWIDFAAKGAVTDRSRYIDCLVHAASSLRTPDLRFLTDGVRASVARLQYRAGIEGPQRRADRHDKSDPEPPVASS